jgi:hypothetical protein
LLAFSPLLPALSWPCLSAIAALGEMRLLPKRFAPYVYGTIQAAITTAVATAIATGQLTGFSVLFLERWALAWLVAWATMLPVVILLAPLIERAVRALTACKPVDGVKPRG